MSPWNKRERERERDSVVLGILPDSTAVHAVAKAIVQADLSPSQCHIPLSEVTTMTALMLSSVHADGK